MYSTAVFVVLFCFAVVLCPCLSCYCWSTNNVLLFFFSVLFEVFFLCCPVHLSVNGILLLFHFLLFPFLFVVLFVLVCWCGFTVFSSFLCCPDLLALLIHYRFCILLSSVSPVVPVVILIFPWWHDIFSLFPCFHFVLVLFWFSCCSTVLFISYWWHDISFFPFSFFLLSRFFYFFLGDSRCPVDLIILLWCHVALFSFPAFCRPVFSFVSLWF